jgi:uncharacterized membrane protein YphA (DoxX/SURF4 family)
MISKIKEQPLLLIRLALGVSFIAHGIAKLSDVAGTAEMLQMSVSLTVVLSILELLAGIGILVNRYAKYAAYTIAIIMIGAIFTVKLKMGYLGGYELDIAYIAMALTIAMMSCTSCSSGTCKVDHGQESTPNHN